MGRRDILRRRCRIAVVAVDSARLIAAIKKIGKVE